MKVMGKEGRNNNKGRIQVKGRGQEEKDGWKERRDVRDRMLSRARLPKLMVYQVLITHGINSKHDYCNAKI